MNKPIAKKVFVSRSVMLASWKFLRQDGLKGVESTVLWAGRRFGDEAVVTTILYPSGPGVHLSRALIEIDSATTAEMGRCLRAHDLAALAQVHSHPGIWVGHSATDSDFSIASSEGFLSLVWPSFAAECVPSASGLGVHRLEGGAWRELMREEADDLIRILEDELVVWRRDEPSPKSLPVRKSGRG